MRNASLGLAALVVLGITLVRQMQDSGPADPASPVSDAAQAPVAADRAPGPDPADATPAPASQAATRSAAPAAPAALPAGPEPSTARTTTAAVELDVDVSKSSLLPRLLYGFNTNNITGDYGYLDPIYKSIVSDLHASLLRFPGGTVANFYHWQTGKFEVSDVDEETGGKAQTRTAGSIRSLEQKRGGVVALSDFMSLCKAYGVRPLFVVNVYSGTPEESAAWVREAKTKGYDVAGWEIGNEMYLPAYKDRFPNPASFIAAAKQHVAAMKAVDPTIQVAVPASPAGFHKEGAGKAAYENQWDTALGKETFYDGVVAHLYTYSKAGRKNFTQDMMRGYLYGSTEVGLANALDYYREKYGTRRLWITEWNLANPKNGIANTQLQAVFAGDFFLGMMQSPDRIRIGVFHVLTATGKGFPLISPADAGDAVSSGDVKRAVYYAFKTAGDALSASDRQLAVTVKRAPSVAGSLEFEGARLAGVRSVAVASDSTVTVLVTNRTEQDQPLAITLSGRAVTGNVCWEGVGNRNLMATNGGNAELQGTGRDEVTIRTWCGDVRQVTLPANSFVALKVPNVKVPRPSATAADSAMVE